MKTLLLTLLTLPLSVLAVEPMDNYYADDLIDAVNQAKERPHHYDYSSTYRYKRTTAQSIELNRLDLEELDETRLSMKGKAIDTTPQAGDEDLLTLNSNINEPKQAISEAPVIDIQSIMPTNSQYQSNYGHYASEGVISQGVVISTPRP